MVSGATGEHYTQYFVEDCYADPQANGWLNEGKEPFGPAVELLEEYGVGLIATSGEDIRIAFSCLEVDAVEPLFETLHEAIQKLQ